MIKFFQKRGTFWTSSRKYIKKYIQRLSEVWDSEGAIQDPRIQEDPITEVSKEDPKEESINRERKKDPITEDPTQDFFCEDLDEQHERDLWN